MTDAGNTLVKTHSQKSDQQHPVRYSLPLGIGRGTANLMSTTKYEYLY